MKKSILSFLILTVLIFTGCGNKKSDIIKAKPFDVNQPFNKTINLIETNQNVYATYTDNFDLDYTPCLPEPESVPKRIGTKFKGSQGGSTSEVPGTRKLDAYETKYNTKRGTYEDFNKTEEASDGSVDESSSLTVEDWGPQEQILSTMTNPTFYVVFSEPVKSLSALSTPTDKSDIMTITPAVKGVFRWYGTSQLCFECSENLEPSTTYTITVSSNLTSIAKHKISGDLEFSTKTENVKITSVEPGSTKTFKYIPKTNGLLLENSQDAIVKVNGKITAESFKNAVKISNLKTNEDLAFTVEAENTNTKGDTFYVHLTAKPEADTGIRIATFEGETLTSKMIYYTLRKFTLARTSKYEMNGGILNNLEKPMRVEFTQDIDEKTLKGKLFLDMTTPVAEANYKVSGKYLTVYGLPCEPETNHKLMFEEGIRDIYGQPFADNPYYINFYVKKPGSFYSLCDYGAKMLEAQFPHQLAFDYQNLLAGRWTIRNTKTPLNTTWNPKIDDSLEVHQYDISEKNKNVLSGVEFDDLLEGGYGWIEFTTDYSYEYHNQWRNTYERQDRSSQLIIQVTDLGITARVGVNKVVALVRSLKTDQPVSGAHIKLYLNDNSDDLSAEPIATGTTDKNGLAVFKIPQEKIHLIEQAKTSPALLVTYNKDKAAFIPTGNGYSNGIYSARKVHPRVFIFSDRGLYKPGETITFRGIDKNQFMGGFSSYTGEYKVSFEDYSWYNPEVFGTEQGKNTESGGFYGSFKIPENIKPGTYVLKYSRKNKDGWNHIGSCHVRIEFFEGAKIQTEIEIPDVTYYGGSTIRATVRGSYLAGGALSNAKFENSWYRHPVRFRPETAETAGFVFGPKDFNDYKNYLTSEKGTLSGSGTTSASFNTEKSSNGAPYSYRLESSLTDISNQQISASKTVLVHPAKYYIGLATPNTRGFPEKNKKLDFSYILVTPDGKTANPSLVQGDIKLTVKKINWELSNVNGVNDSIYSRWEKTEKVVKEEILKPQTNGSFSYTPENAGEYLVQVQAADNKGNSVITERSFYATGSDAQWFSYGSETSINVTPDQSMYNPGDTAKIMLQSSLPAGDYLITVEREGIFTEEVKHFDSSVNVIDVPVAMNYVPCAYVTVSSYSKRTGDPASKWGEKDLNKPKGYYGYARINVNPYVKAFSVDVKMDKKIYRPGETATVTLTATKGGVPLPEAELTVMGVDRAVVDLINYHVPNPIEYFYDPYHFDNCVIGGDSRDMLMDPVTYAIKNLNGGDAAEDELKEQQRKDFRPTAFFKPALVTDKDGQATFTFVIPSQLTTFRVTAFGVRGEQFALQEDEFGVRNPINVQAVQPKTLRVRDTAECGVLLTNLENKPADVEISLEIRNPEKNSSEDEINGLITFPGKALIDGASTKKVTVQSEDSTVVYFDVAAREPGTVSLVYTVRSSDLNEKLFSDVKINKTYTYESVVSTGELSDKEKEDEQEEKIIIPGWADDNMGSLEVTLDATQLGPLGSSVKYVFEYPYGCFEQRASGALPLVIFDKYLRIFGLDSRVANTKTFIKKLFKLYAQNQKQDGGFGYWKESIASNLYVSIRIADLYNKCVQAGYSEKSLSIHYDDLISYILRETNSSTVDSSTKAYGYLTVCEGWKAEYLDSRIQRVFEAAAEEKNLDAMAICGLCYSSYGLNNNAKAQAIVKEIKKYIQEGQRSVSFTNVNCTEETLSHILKLFVLANPAERLNSKLLFTLFSSQKRGYWQNTRTTSQVLDAIKAYIQVNNLDATDLTAFAELNGNKLAEGTFKGAGADPVTKNYEFTSEVISKTAKNKPVSLKYKKSGNGKLYYTTKLTYALPDELQNARDEGINITYEIFDADSDALVIPESGTKLIKLESGKTYKARIVMATGKNRDFIALRTPVPSGAGILNAAFETVSSKAALKTESSGKTWREKYGRYMASHAIYEDECQFFWDYFRAGSYNIEFMFRAERRGVYPCPPVQAECMYEPEVFGRSDGYLFVIE